METISTMGNGALTPMLILFLAIPAVLCLAGGEVMRRMGLIKPGDLEI
jgi:hypothetical protein